MALAISLEKYTHVLVMMRDVTVFENYKLAPFLPILDDFQTLHRLSKFKYLKNSQFRFLCQTSASIFGMKIQIFHTF